MNFGFKTLTQTFLQKRSCVWSKMVQAINEFLTWLIFFIFFKHLSGNFYAYPMKFQKKKIAGIASKINQDANFTLKFDEIEQISEQLQPIKTWFFASEDMCLEITYS